VETYTSRLKNELKFKGGLMTDFEGSKSNILEDLLDTHIHTAPDPKPRILSDVDAANQAKIEGMGAIVLKSHLESTAGRARIASQVSDFQVIGGVTLNNSVGGLNPDAVEAAALHGGRIVWMPTINHNQIKLDEEKLISILNMVRDYDLALATGHLNPEEIFFLLDQARSLQIRKIIVNHPLTRVVGATLEEQKEMSRYAYLEHCLVACMPLHDGLNPAVIRDVIQEVGADRCIMATDFGQVHNPSPVVGMQMFIRQMMELGIKWDDIQKMCRENPTKLILD